MKLLRDDSGTVKVTPWWKRALALGDQEAWVFAHDHHNHKQEIDTTYYGVQESEVRTRAAVGRNGWQLYSTAAAALRMAGPEAPPSARYVLCLVTAMNVDDVTWIPKWNGEQRLATRRLRVKNAVDITESLHWVILDLYLRSLRRRLLPKETELETELEDFFRAKRTLGEKTVKITNPGKYPYLSSLDKHLILWLNHGPHMAESVFLHQLMYVSVAANSYEEFLRDELKHYLQWFVRHKGEAEVDVHLREIGAC